MTVRTFIPTPAVPFVDLNTGYITPDWYLFLSRRISGSTGLLDGIDWGMDQNVLSAEIFNRQVQSPISLTSGNDILAGQIFGP